MSKLVDERVVEMSFDNKKFEENVGTTLGTIDKLKKALDFKDATESFAGIEAAANDVDFSGFENAVGSIGDHMNGFEAIAFGVFNRIGGMISEKVAEIVGTVARGVASVTTDLGTVANVGESWGKYNEYNQSVQSLVNATGKDIDEIEGYLSKLMWYSDETAFSFTEMASALSQAALVGADLGSATDMIIGVANATAYAGKEGFAFQSTIRNLMQSYGSGSLKYMDYKSLIQQGTATNQMTQEIIKAAEELGTIEPGQITLANFNDTLKDDWATSEVMELAFSRFGEYTEMAYQMVQSGAAATAEEAFALLEQTNTGLEEFQIRAAASASEAISFRQAVDATVEAVQSKIMMFFKYIFGNYAQAKKLWTDLSFVLYDAFAARYDSLLEVMNLWYSGIDGAKSGFEYFWEGVYNIFEGIGSILDTIKDAWAEVFPKKEAEEVAHSLSLIAYYFSYYTLQFKKFVQEEGRAEKFASVIKGIASIFSILKTTASAVFRIISSLIGAFAKGVGAGGGFTKAFDGVLGILAAVGDTITWVAEKYAEIVEAFVNGTAFQTALGWISEKVGFIKEQVAGFISSIWPTVQNILKTIGQGALYAVGGVILGIGKAIQFVYETLRQAALAVSEFVQHIQALFRFSAEGNEGIVQQLFDAGLLSETDLKIIEFFKHVRAAWETLKDVWESVSNFFVGVYESVSTAVTGIIEKFKEFASSKIDETGEGISSGLTSAKDALVSFWETIKGIGSKVKEQLLELWEGIKQAFLANIDISGFEKIADAFKKFWEALGNGGGLTDSGEESGILKFLNALWEGLKILVPAIVGLVTDLASILVNGISDAFSSGGIKDTFEGINAGLGTGLLVQLIGLFKNLKNVTSTGEGSPFSSIFDALKEMKEAGQDVDKIKAIGLVIVELAGSLLLLSLVDSAKLSIAMFALMGVIGELKALIALSSASGLTDFLAATKAISKMGAAVAAIGVALAALTVTVGKYGGDSLFKAVGAISLLLVELAAFAVALGYLGKNEVIGDLPDMGSELLLMAGAVLILAEAVKVVGKLEKPIAAATAIVILLAALTGVIVALAAVQKKMGGVEGMAGIGFGLFEIANAILVLVGALAIVSVLKNIDTALLTIGALVLMVGALIAVVGAFKPEHMLAIGAGIALIANSIVALVGVMALLQIIKFEDIESSLIALMVTIALIGGLIIGAGSIPGGAAGFLAFGAAFTLVANATLALAAAFIALASAISKLGWKPILTAAGIFAGFIVVIGVVMALLTPIAPLLLVVGAAFALLGAGVLMLVNALLILVPAMAAIVLGADVLYAGVNVLVNAFMQFFIGILVGIQNLATTIVDTLILLVDQFVIRILEYLIENIPRIVEDLVLVVIVLLKGLNDSLETHRGELELEIGRLVALLIEIVIMAIVEALKKLWEDSGIGTWLEETWGKISDWFHGIWDSVKTWWQDNVSGPIQEAFASIKEWWDEKVATPFNDAISAIETFIDEKFVQPIKKAWEWLDEHIFTPLKQKSDEVSGKVSEFFTGIGDTITGWYEGIKKWVTEKIEAVKQTLTQLWNDVTAIFSELMGDIGGVLTGDLDFYETALKWINRLVQGVKDFTHLILDKVDDIMSGIADKLGILDFYETAKQWIQGLINGIKEGIETVAQAASDVVNSAVGAVKKVLKIKSPSRVMMEIGGYTSEGLAIGIRDSASEVTDAAEGLGEDTLSTVKSAMDSVMDVMSSDDVYSPTITPVYDLTNLYAGRDQINSLLDSDPTAMQFKMGDEEGLQAAAAEINDSNVTVADAIDDMYTRLSDFMTKVKGEFGDNTVTLNVYGTEGQDVEELADIVSYRINAALQRERAVYS